MLIPLTHEAYRVRVADRQYGATVFHQIAEFEACHIQHVRRRECQVELQFRVYLHGVTEAGETGPEVVAPDVQPRLVTLRANNTTAVYFNPANPGDPRNGEILLDQDPTKTGEEWDAAIEALPEPAAKQGLVFSVLMQYPQVVKNMVLAEVARADAAPFHKFRI
ncbi:MAG TPA: hypothetical protein VF630_16205 [Hymenobacter sp.]|jgi:hypothetical protein